MPVPQPSSADSQPNRHSVRASIDRLQSVIGRAAALSTASERLRPMAAHQLTVLIDQQVEARMDKIPIAELKHRAGHSAKLGPLEAAGFKTARAILRVPAHRLAAVKGVGPQTIEPVKEAVQALKSELTAEARFLFDPDHPDDAQTSLLAVLTAIRAGDAVKAKLGGQVHELQSQAARLIPAARSATKRFLLSRAKKAASLAAAREIETALIANAELIARLDDFTRLVDPAFYRSEQLWTRYRDEAADYYSLLSTLNPSAAEDDRDAARGHLGTDQVRAVTETALDKRLLKATLRGYQEFGAQFVLHRRRAIIGDEMGLGKTVQALAACAHLAAKGREHFLVVCPASVLHNWMAEIEKHTRLTAHKLHGDFREPAGLRWLREGGVAVTTFDTLSRLRCLDGAPGFAVLTVDEAHHIKNPDTNRAQTVLKFIDRSERILFLSGTPMENRVEEFRNLVAYLRPKTAARIAPDAGLAGARSFRRKVAEVYLRRNQVDVLHELPERIEVEEWVQLSAADERIYRKILAEPTNLGTLEKLRHAAYQSADSAKLDRLLDLVREAVEDGQKVVIFSRYLDVLGRIGDGLHIPVAGTITGSVPIPKRQALIDEFTRGDEAMVLLSQIDTGGTGINLQAASVVVIAEPQWKPSIEEQAIARLHRMGQTRTVQVHRVLAKASVDELLLEVQGRKRLLFDAFARKSAAKDADRRAVETSRRPAFFDDESIPLGLRVVMAEQHRAQQSGQ